MVLSSFFHCFESVSGFVKIYATFFTNTACHSLSLTAATADRTQRIRYKQTLPQ